MSASSQAVSEPASCRLGAVALNTDGTLGPLTEGSTQVTTLVEDNAGITPVSRFIFEIPQTLIR
jgi:hypothetical protein